MDIISPGQTQIFFRKVALADSHEIRLNADMIRLLMVIDENKDLFQISNEVGMDIRMLNDTLSKLLKLNLIEPVKKDTQFLNDRFLKALKANLSHATGPMAQFLMEDVISEMEVTMSEIPRHQAPELISNISREIPDENARIKFKKTMIEIIKKDKI